MLLGLFVAPFAELAEPARVAELARDAEAAGWDGLFLWDHVLHGRELPVADTWVTLAAAAAATSRIRLGPMVTPLARRRPWVLARQIATLDRLAGGRLTVGVGLGTDASGEFSSFGEVTEPRVRAAVLDESLEIVRALLAGDPVEFAGDHHSVRTDPFRPGPAQDRVPFWGACEWPNRRPLARAARLEGCFPIFPTPEPPPPPAGALVRQVGDELRRLGAPGDGDLVVRFDFELATPDTFAELAAAGATWALSSYGAGVPPAAVIEEDVRRGPPSPR